MVNHSKVFRAVILVASVASLSACGGGGGGGGSSATAPTPPANTGLSAPTLTLSQSINAVTPLVQEMTLTYGLADEAQATRALGSLVPGVGNTATSPFACTSGDIAFTKDPASGILSYTYNNCSDGTYTFSGTSSVTPTPSAGPVTSYRLVFNGQVSGPGGLSATITNGTLACTPAATAGQAPSCTTTAVGYVWGYDISYAANGAANGSHQCDCGQGSWNVTFKNFTATGGVAEVFATNGSAIVTRTAAKMFTVEMFAGGEVRTYTVPLP
jgi:hypothetical protein